MQWFRCLAIPALFALIIMGRPAVAADVCPASDDTAGAITPFPQVASVLRPGGRLNVLAVGSATMFGPDASVSPGTITSQSLDTGSKITVPPKEILSQQASQRAFPWQMAKALQAAIPDLQVDVVVRGGRGMTAGDMLPLLQSTLQAGRYQLVLWQTGTVEAVRNSSPSDFAQALSEGVEAIQGSGADLVMIDPQYSRFLQTNSNLDPYLQDLQQAASMPGVMLFHRFDLMRSWANEGGLDLEHTAKADRKRVVDAVHACIGSHLARMIIAAARS